MEKLILGIDTSNYTTSVCVMNTEGELLASVKRPLPVKEGERGLRQSDAVFAHVKNLPSAMDEVKEYISGGGIVAVGVSTRPRNIDGSYMPCFLSGAAAARAVSASLGIPEYSFSHQCGHISAALYSSGRTDLFEKEFCAFHVSGGTTEMLRVSPSGSAFSAQLIGGTADLNAGQVIDRVGVAMGLRFPAGAEMEALALQNTAPVPKRKPKINGYEVNLSGLENLALKLFRETGDRALTSAFTLDYVGRALYMLAEAYERDFGRCEFVFAGGVMSNSIIKDTLRERFSASFAEPQLSADNAVGIAYLTYRAHKSEMI